MNSEEELQIIKILHDLCDRDRNCEITGKFLLELRKKIRKQIRKDRENIDDFDDFCEREYSIDEQVYYGSDSDPENIL